MLARAGGQAVLQARTKLEAAELALAEFDAAPNDPRYPKTPERRFHFELEVQRCAAIVEIREAATRTPLEKARVALAELAAEADALVGATAPGQPLSNHTIGQLQLMSLRRERAQRLVENLEAEEAATLQARADRHALVESHTAIVAEAEKALMAARGALVSALRAKDLGKVDACAAGFNAALATVHAQFTKRGLTIVDKHDATGPLTDGAVRINGAEWVSVDAEKAAAWCLLEHLRNRPQSDALIVERARHLLGFNSADFQTVQRDLIAATVGHKGAKA